MTAINAIKDGTVIVFVDGSNLHLTPEPVQDSFASDAAAGPTPIIVVFDAAIEKELGIVGYKAIRTADGFKDVKAELTKLRGKTPEAGKQSSRLPEMWKDTKGRTMRATFVESTEEEVTVRLKNGQISTLKLSMLSPESQKRVAEISGE